MSNWTDFSELCQESPPRGLIVLGSGLGEVAAGLQLESAISFAEIPGLVPPTVQGHRGQLQLGLWKRCRVLISLGRVHGYEGHSIDRVTHLIRLCASFGIQHLLLTNAAGGIRSDLRPGSLMPIRSHLKWLGPQAWMQSLQVHEVYETDWVQTEVAGVYAALTGPNYETPAEIRALRAIGADAVGMSTAREAEAGKALGLKVYGISCITNAAAGLVEGTLHHAEVEANARLSTQRLTDLLDRIVHRWLEHL